MYMYVSIICLQNSHFKSTGRHIEFKIQKVGQGEVWPRLTVQQKKPAWLKIDFDHFAFDDDSDDNVADPGLFSVSLNLTPYHAKLIITHFCKTCSKLYLFSSFIQTQEEDLLKNLERDLADTKTKGNLIASITNCINIPPTYCISNLVVTETKCNLI